MTLSPTEEEIVAAWTPLHVGDQEGGLDVELKGEDIGTVPPDD